MGLFGEGDPDALMRALLAARATRAAHIDAVRRLGGRFVDAMRTVLMIVLAATQAVGQDGGTPATSRTTESPASRPGADECRREVRFVMEDGGPVPYLMVYAGSATMAPRTA